MVEPTRIPFLSLFFAYNICFWPALLLLLFRRNHEPIKSRGWLLLTLQTLYGFFAFLIPALGPKTAGCFLFVFRSPVVVLWAFPYVIRATLLWFRYVLQHSLIVLKQAGHQSYLTSGEMVDISESLSKESPPPLETKDAASNVAARNIGEIKPWKVKLASFISKNVWLFTWKFDLFIYSSLFVAFEALSVLRYYFEPFIHPEEVRADFSSPLPERCELERDFLFQIILVAITVVGVVITALLLRSAKDTYHVKNELVAIFISILVLFPLWIVGNLELFPRSLNRYFWDLAFAFAFVFISFWFPIIMTFVFDRRKRIDSLHREGSEAFGPEIILKIMEHPILRERFAELLSSPFPYSCQEIGKKAN